MSEEENTEKIDPIPPDKDIKVHQMFAFVATGEDGEEGVMAFSNPGDNLFMPMVGADLERAVSLVPMADRISEASGLPYRIRKFTEWEDVTDSTQAAAKAIMDKMDACEHGEWKFPRGEEGGFRVCGKCGHTEIYPQKQEEDDDFEDEPLGQRQEDACPVDGKEDCESCQ